MGFEKFRNAENDNNKPDPELAKVLDSLGKAVEENEVESYPFTTSSGYTGVARYAKNKLVHISINQSGVTSSFSIDENGLYLESLRGPDDEHIDSPIHRTQHLEEAQRLVSADELPKPPDQYELPL